MAKVALSFASSILCLLFVSSFFSGEFSLLVNAEWCVAKSGTPDAALMFIIDDICGKIKDCLAIMDGGPCYFPNTTSDHASFIMNLYYKTMVRDCNFSGVGEITQIDRSHGECVYV